MNHSLLVSRWLADWSCMTVNHQTVPLATAELFSMNHTAFELFIGVSLENEWQ